MNEVEELRARVAQLEKIVKAQQKTIDAQQKTIGEIMQAQQKTIGEQQRIIDAQQERIEELERLLKLKNSEKEVPDFVKRNVKHRNKTPGQKEGHKGTTRPIPGKIDEEEKLSLKRCPECGHEVSEPVGIREHIVEDIIPARVIVKKYIITRHYCKHCKKIVEQKPTDVFPNYRFGLNLCILVMLLRMGCALPIDKIKVLLETTYGLGVSSATIQNILYKCKEEFKGEYERILEEVRNAEVTFVDETGARIKGKNSWLWAFISEMAAFYVLDRSRGRKVPKRVLRKNFKGVLSSDCYNAYESMNCRKQKCLAHYLREIKKWEEKFSKKGEFAQFARKAKRLFKDAIRAHKRLRNKADRLRAKKRFEGRLRAIYSKEYKNPEINRICKNFMRHSDESFTFLEIEGVEPTNNIAERAIRPYVVMRKISGCHRSRKGADACQTLLSIYHTCKLRDQNFVEYAKEYLSEGLSRASGT
jgi:transposase